MLATEIPPQASFGRKMRAQLERPVSIAPLVTFRIAFGLLMLFSTTRYLVLGWVDTQLVEPLLHFKYYGFAWVEPLSSWGMYAVFALMIIASIGIMLGWYYRCFAVLFFLSFTYVELIDITYYLNHYYFVSLVAFLLIWLPANRFFSLDVYRKPALRQTRISAWQVNVLQLQIAIVYIYAGLAKINTDWLCSALPLSIWLPAKSSLPLIGFVFDYPLTAYVFSWAGMFFDTFIIAGLLYSRTRSWAFLAVLVFHTLTGLLFQIGIFPLVMIALVTIFFSSAAHERFLRQLARLMRLRLRTDLIQQPFRRASSSFVLLGFLFFMLIQLLFPWRYLLYPGNVFWTEEGYRFSWRVMLMEKAGTATFYVQDSITGKEGAVINHQFLNAHQEKQMAMQPDLLIQFAHYLKDYYAARGVAEPKVRAEVWVTLNGRPAQLLFDPTLDLSALTDTWAPKSWILPYPEINQQ